MMKKNIPPMGTGEAGPRSWLGRLSPVAGVVAAALALLGSACAMGELDDDDSARAHQAQEPSEPLDSRIIRAQGLDGEPSAMRRGDSLVRLSRYADLDRELFEPRDTLALAEVQAESDVQNLAIIIGTSGNDVLIGTPEDDTLQGLEGRDTLIGGPGADILDGGPDADTASYSTATSGVAVDLATGMGTLGDAAGDILISIENLRGSSHDDILAGDSGNNSILGAGGNDMLYGREGDDTLIGGPGADVHDGGPGNDWASYAGSTGVTADLVFGGSAGDALGDTYISIERLRGSEYADILRGDSAGNVLLGAGGDDVLDGREGDDSLIGGPGADTLIGGPGADLASYAASTAGVSVNLATGQGSGGEAEGDTLIGIEDVRGSDHDDVLIGDDNDNVLVSAGGDDVLMGRGGDDVLMGGAGADVIDGGEGFDFASYAGSTAGVTINLETGLVTGGDATGDTLISIENLSGSSHSDVLIGDSGPNVISGHYGNDTLDGRGGIDTVSYGYSTEDWIIDLAAGTASSPAEFDSISNFENVIGSQGNDIILGDAGRNLIDGNTGNDVIDGGAGIDTVYYGSRTEGWLIDLASGTATSGDETDTLISIENVVGSQGDDHIIGDSGPNVLAGGPGADIIDGGAGTDVASYADARSGVSVNLSLGQGTAGEAAGDVLINIEDLRGSRFADTLIGDAGSNVLTGAEGDDTLDGREGNDFLIGGPGADVLIGGPGKDMAVYSSSPAGVTVNLSSGVGIGGDAAGDVLFGIEDVRGSDFADVLIGDAGDNVLVGAGGDDVLDGRGGNDVLLGGPGNDTFIFGPGYGHDRIAGFVAGPGTEDVIDVSAFGFVGLADILARAEQVGTYVIITIDAATKLILIDVNLADLSADDFIF
jgi:Ca2+-binding RTX toxin-like protein